MYLNFQEHPKMFSGGIWAFHFGYDNNAYPSMERAAQLIQNTGEYVRLVNDLHKTVYNVWMCCAVEPLPG